MKILLLLICTFLLPNNSNSPGTLSKQNEDLCQAKIEESIDRNANIITFKALGINHSSKNTEFSYRFSIKKSGPSGTSSNRQGGKMNAKAHETIYLSTQSLDYKPGNKYTLKLKVKTNNGCSTEIERELEYEKEQKE